MKKSILIVMIASACQIANAQENVTTAEKTAELKPTITVTETEKAKNPADSINPFKRRQPRQRQSQNPYLGNGSLEKRDSTPKPSQHTIENKIHPVAHPVHEHNTSKPVVSATPQPAAMVAGSTTTLNSNIDFKITGCIGDATAQTVTVFYTFFNPRKVNQLIWIGANGIGKNYNKKAIAFDQNGNQFSFGGATLAQVTHSRQVKAQLPTGIPTNGSIKFINVLPNVNKFILINIPSGSSNWDGGGDKKDGIIEIKDININWQ